MPFTVQEIENASNSMIDYHYKTPEVRSQTLQDKPLLKKMMGLSKPFPGGKENITGRVKGDYTTTIQGFEHDDTVTYQNPANIRTWTVPWKLIHSGIEFTMHEMAKAGITINDSTTGEGETRHTQIEKVQLADMLNDKIEDMKEGTDRGMNTMFWRDGTQDSKLIPGIRSFILDDPTTATVVAGIDQSTNDWWRNRSNVSITLGDTTGDSQAVLNVLQSEMRQLRRFGGRPNCAFAGSDFLERLELELKAKGVYTQTGWANKGRIDGSIDDVAFKGINIEYDPTLDDLGLSKRVFFLDSRHIYPMHIDGEKNKQHRPARPADQYVFYRALTSMGGLVCRQRNCHGVYGFA